MGLVGETRCKRCALIDLRLDVAGRPRGLLQVGEVRRQDHEQLASRGWQVPRLQSKRRGRRQGGAWQPTTPAAAEANRDQHAGRAACSSARSPCRRRWPSQPSCRAVHAHLERACGVGGHRIYLALHSVLAQALHPPRHAHRRLGKPLAIGVPRAALRAGGGIKGSRRQAAAAMQAALSLATASSVRICQGANHTPEAAPPACAGCSCPAAAHRRTHSAHTNHCRVAAQRHSPRACGPARLCKASPRWQGRGNCKQGGAGQAGRTIERAMHGRQQPPCAMLIRRAARRRRCRVGATPARTHLAISRHRGSCALYSGYILQVR